MKSKRPVLSIILRDQRGRLVCRIPCDSQGSLDLMKEKCEYKGRKYKYVGFHENAATFIEIDEA
jgi:hypothetical protein